MESRVLKDIKNIIEERKRDVKYMRKFNQEVKEHLELVDSTMPRLETTLPEGRKLTYKGSLNPPLPALNEYEKMKNRMKKDLKNSQSPKL